MKDRIYSSDTEKWVFIAVCMSVCLCLLYLSTFSAAASEYLDFSTLCVALFFLLYCIKNAFCPKGLKPVNCEYLYVYMRTDYSSYFPIGRGGADLWGLAEHLLGPAATNQASDAGWSRAYPTTTLLYILALGLQSGQSRVRGPDGSCYISWLKMVTHDRSIGAYRLGLGRVMENQNWINVVTFCKWMMVLLMLQN